MSTWIENMSSSIDNAKLSEIQKSLNEISGYLKNFCNEVSDSWGIQGIEDVKNIDETDKINDGGRLDGEELKETQDHFTKFLDLSTEYTIPWIFYDRNSKKYRVKVEFTPKWPWNFKTTVSTDLYFEKTEVWDNKALEYKIYKNLAFSDKDEGVDFVVDWWAVRVYDTYFDFPNLTDKNQSFKKIPFYAEYNELKTDEWCKKKLEQAQTSFESFSIDKEIPEEIKDKVWYSTYAEKDPKYEDSILNKFKLESHLKDIQLSKDTKKEGNSYIKKLVLKNGKENIPLDAEIKYKIDEKGKLVIDQDSFQDKQWNLKTFKLKVDGFQFNNIKIREDPNDSLNVQISFDSSELKAYGNHMKKGICAVYEAARNASFSGNDFSKLKDKIEYFPWKKETNKWTAEQSQRSLNIENLEGYYYLKLADNVLFPLEFDGTQVQCRDKCGKNVKAMNFEYMVNGKKMSTVAKIWSGTNNEWELGFTDKKEKVQNYQYLDFSLPGMNYTNIQGKYQEWANKNFLLTWQSWWQVKNLAELTVDYDKDKWYSLDKTKNKVKLEAKYFYHALPKIWNLSGKVTGLSDVAIKNLFDKKFANSNIKDKEYEGAAIVDNKFCTLDVDKQKVTFNEKKIPTEVQKMFSDITNIVDAGKQMSEYNVLYNGQDLKNNIAWANGIGYYFKIDHIDSDPKFHCFLTQLTNSKMPQKNDVDIQFNYKTWTTGSQFSLDPNSKERMIDGTKVKVSVDTKNKNINLTTIS